MSRAISPATSHAYGLARVTRVWHLSRATVYRKRPFWALLPLAGMNVLGRSGAGSFRTTLWIALTTTRRVSGIAGSRF
jgi:hypothetical protein